MPVIRVEYDDKKVNESDMTAFCRALKEVVSVATGIKEVFVWGNTSQIKIDVEPIEVWIEMSEHKVDDLDSLTNSICEGVTKWKKASGFETPVTITLTPVHWKFVVGV